MKKSYKAMKAFIVLLCAISFEMGAQALSGVYTINSAQVTNYPTGTNFQSFTDLATALNTNGVNGPVTVNVAANSGPYVEQPQFNAIGGTSGSNKIVINGNNNIVTFNSTSSAAPWTIGLNGADWMTFNDLDIIGTGTTYALVVKLSNAADYNTFNNCKMTCNPNQQSTSQVPFSLSSSMTSPTSGGSNSGNYNTVNSCTLSNGYYGFTMYGLTSAPYNTNNAVKNCLITDFYVYGMYYPYSKDFTVANNIIERPTRTANTTIYGMYGYYSHNLLCEGNLIHKLVESNIGTTSALYGIYNYGNPISGGGRNIYRNNILKDFKNNGTIYGFYVYYSGSDIYNNTLDFDWSAATSGSTIYGMYPYGGPGYEMTIHNNIVTIRRGGSASSRYPLYIAVTGNITVDYNNLISVGTSGTNYLGYYNGAHASQTAWQGAGMDANGHSMDPMYASALDLHPTNPAFNNLGMPMGLVFDQELAVRNQLTPDIGALEFMSPVCNGAPPSNTVTTPNYAICPGEDVSMGLAYLDPSTGYTYQWQTSTISNVGPFTPIPGANGLFYTAPTVTANTYFSVVMTCTAPGGTSIAPVGYVQVAGPTNSTVPAYEGFEQVGKPNRLPNCSWAASHMGQSNLTSPSAMSGNRVPRSGTSFGYFSNASPGTSYFFTNPIAMNTGITYSAAVWYATEYFGYNNWTSLEILVGPNQSSVGMVQVASVSPAISGPFKLLDNTFTVPSSGNYYVAIKAVSASGSAQYLTIDDLSITIPCEEGSPNSPTVSLAASDTVICAGQSINLSAVGADTYSWSTGGTQNTISDIPMTNTVYTVYGTRSISGCIQMKSVAIQVLPLPNMIVVASSPVVCAGKPVSLTAYGAVTYVWASPLSSNNANVSVNPTSTSQYTVLGTGANGCTGEYVTTVSVNPLPVVSASTSKEDACKDDELVLLADGGISYMWHSNVSPAILQGNPITIKAASSTIFTVIAVDANGCENMTTVIQNISECTGIAKNGAALAGMEVYPNPTNGTFNVILNNNSEKNVTVTDVTGRVILTTTSNEEVIGMDITNLSAGVYYVKVQSENIEKVVKIVKN